jgi:tRNA pseudouridine13 synthase
MGKSYLTENHPGTGGSIKVSPEDFLVEEIPLYLPCGAGEHLYLFIEKRGITTLGLVKKLARATGLLERDIGYAGLKDARGLTRQWISLPAATIDLKTLATDDSWNIISAEKHRNKLRLGHLSGNRFRIRIRGTVSQAFARAETILADLGNKGVPNSFGAQRFGVMGNSHHIGRAILKGDFQKAAQEIIGRPESIQDPIWRNGVEKFIQGDLPGALAGFPQRLRDERRLIEAILKEKPIRKAVLELPRRLLRLYVSAAQSELFDRIVESRIADLGTLWEGDLAVKHSNGAFFLVSDPGKEQPRSDLLEISPSGPLFGYKLNLAQGHAGEMEEAILREEELELEDFRLGGGLKMEGSRRPLRVPLTEKKLEADGEDLIVSFALPAGSYATNVTDEITKTECDDSGKTIPVPIEENLPGDGLST